MEKAIQFGYARKEITPADPVPLAGYGNTLQRISQGVLDPLMATCLAATDDQGNTVLLISLDMVGTADVYAPAARKAISEKWNIPYEAVVLAATHTHSGPDMLRLEHPGIQRHISDLTEILVQLTGEALEDRCPGRMEWAKAYNEKMNYVRHYILENDTVCGDNYGDPTEAPFRCHISEADKEIRLVRILREDAKDILIVNWQAHPTMASTSATEYGREHRPFISADYVGACRRYVEEKTDLHFIYFQGAAGNINSRSRMDTEIDTREPAVYGQQLGDYIIQGIQNMQPLAGGVVAAEAGTFCGDYNHQEDSKLPAAQKIREEWIKTNDPKRCMAMGKPYGIHSAYHAGSIVVKAELPESTDVPVGAGCIGDLGFAFMPCEVFDTNGKQIRESSPYKMTMVLSCANGAYSYFPSRQAFAHGCYEADMCRFAPGIGEKTADAAVGLLKKIAEER